jgi:ubiquitin carboxyl-terminal hydrolase 5/13
MGFSSNGSKRALVATGSSDAEVAMNWMLEHMEDPDFNEPLSETSSAVGSAGPVDYEQESVIMIESMGYNSTQAKAALSATDNNLERALDWIFSRDDLDQAVAEVLASQQGQSSASTSASANTNPTEVRYMILYITQ